MKPSPCRPLFLAAFAPLAPFALLAMFLVGLAAGPASAQDLTSEVADALDGQGWYVEPGAEVSEGDYRGTATDARRQGVGSVVLASEVDGSAQDFADSLLQTVGTADLHTILVVTPGELGLASTEYSSGRSNQALDRFEGDALSGTEAVVSFLTGGSGTSTESTQDDSGNTTTAGETSSNTDSGGAPTGLILLGVGAAGVGGAALYSKRQTTKRREENLEKAKAELNNQVSAIAQMVYDLNDRVTLSSDDDLQLRFQEASIEYNEVSDLVDRVDNGPDLAELNDRVDALRWRFDWVEAKLEGRTPPAEPVTSDPWVEPQTSDNRTERVRARRGTCFFDPDHRPGTVPASIETGAQDLDVLICRECARRLEAGELPDPRLVQVGQRRVPAARAPLGYGGIGLALPDLFRILTRSSGRPIDVDWRNWPMPRQQQTLPRNDRLPRRRSSAGRSRRSSAGRRRR